MKEIKEEHIKTKKKINFRELLEPRISRYPNYEILFGVFRWMAKSGEDYKGMTEALSGKPSCINMSQIDIFPRNAIAELSKRFSIILNGNLVTDGVQEWKEDHDVAINNERIIHMPYQNKGTIPDYTVPRDIYEKVWNLFGRDFEESPNSQRPKATKIKGIGFRIYNNAKYSKENDFRYQFEFKYGLSLDHHSSWTYTIKSHKNEPLAPFCARTIEEMREITV